jgi:hypothetical protein
LDGIEGVRVKEKSDTGLVDRAASHGSAGGPEEKQGCALRDKRERIIAQSSVDQHRHPAIIPNVKCYLDLILRVSVPGFQCYFHSERSLESTSDGDNSVSSSVCCFYKCALLKINPSGSHLCELPK